MKYSLYYSQEWLPPGETMIPILKDENKVDVNFRFLDNINQADFAILPFFINHDTFNLYKNGLRK